MSMSIIVDRASVATVESPLALFVEKGRVICQFASTVSAQKRIRLGVGLLAVITKNDCPERIRDILRRSDANV